MIKILKSDIVENAVCPFCGLACDDLKIAVSKLNVQVADTLPDYCRNSYANACLEKEPACLIKGRETDLDSALAHCAKLLKTSRQPLISGLATDVNGARAALNLARDCNAVIDHKNSAVSLRNAQVVQDEGWINCTLAEARNRADMIIVLGTAPLLSFPRLVERIAPPELGHFQTKTPEWILIGPWDQQETLPAAIKERNHHILPMEKDQLNDVPRILNTLLNTATTAAEDDTNHDEWRQWFNKLLACQFPVFTWSSSEFSHLALQALARFLKQMNRKIRCVGLPMAGNQGDLTFHQVCTWQTGAPTRISFTDGNVKYDPLNYDARSLLEQNAADLLIWVSPLDSSPMPTSDIPTILIGHPSAADKTNADVFIPAGIPGLDHTGHFFRTDSVVALMLKKIRHSTLQSAAALLDNIRQQYNN